MRIEEGTKLDFKDVLLRPKRSTLRSRSEVTSHNPTENHDQMARLASAYNPDHHRNHSYRNHH